VVVAEGEDVVEGTGVDEDDAPAVFVQVEVDAAAVDVVAEVVRLFTVVVDGLDLSRDDMVAVGDAGEPWTVTLPDYLASLVVDVAALACRPEPQALRPDEVTSDVLDQAGLLAAIKEETEESFPQLEALFTRLGLPIDVPYAL
jgi:hypothetical protein